MKFIAKYIQVIGLLMLTGFVAAAAALYFDVPARTAKPRVAAPAVAPASSHNDSHAGCNHATASVASEPEASATTGCAHSGGGCCSAKTKAPVPSAGGCTRELVAETERANP